MLWGKHSNVLYWNDGFSLFLSFDLTHVLDQMREFTLSDDNAERMLLQTPKSIFITWIYLELQFHWVSDATEKFEPLIK